MKPRLVFIIVAAVAAIISVILALLQPAVFFQAYLFAAVGWLNPALGCLLFIFIHRMTGGKWGETLQPFFSAGAATVPWALLFALPIYFGLPHLFPWAGAHATTLFAKHPVYLSVGGYLVRAVVYGGIYFWLVWLSRQREAAWTGPVGLIFFVLTTYLLSVDWIISLEPGWYSTGFPLVFMASEAVSALAFSVAACLWTQTRRETGKDKSKDKSSWNDLGSLMLAALMFWAYVSYAEFLIIWSGDLPAQVAWYVHRNAGGWHYVLITLVLLNLLVPVLLLISGSTRRRSRRFAVLTSAIVFFQFVYLYWIITPAFSPDGFSFHLLDIILPLGLGGLFCFFYSGQLRKEIAQHA